MTPRPSKLPWILPLALGGVCMAGLTLAFLLWLPGSRTQPTPRQARATDRPTATVVLRLHGSNTIGAKLAPALATAFLKRQLGATRVRVIQTKHHGEWRVVGRKGARVWAVDIHGHGSTTAFVDLRAGLTDIGLASRRILPEESEVLHRLGEMTSRDCEHILGLDGIAVILHPSRTATLPTLTARQLSDIFTGRISRWDELGLGRGRIRLYARNHRSGTFQFFRQVVLRGRRLAAGARRFESNARLSEAVARDPNGIGFTALPYVRTNRVVAVRIASGLFIAPDASSLSTEDYALARRLYLYTAARPTNRYVRRFVDFALSSAGQDIVRRIGFVPLRIRAFHAQVPAGVGARDPRRLAAYRRAVQGAKRLSVNLRFRRDGFTLDNRGLRDLERLADFFKSQRGRRPVVVGFSAAHPHYAQAVAAGLKRAQSVAAALKGRGVSAPRAISAGPELPVASNQTPSGQQRNRRVEVWVR